MTHPVNPNLSESLAGKLLNAPTSRSMLREAATHIRNARMSIVAAFATLPKPAKADCEALRFIEKALEAIEFRVPVDAISARSLRMMDAAIRNYRKGRVSKSVQ